MPKEKYLITLKTLQKKIYNKLCDDQYKLLLRKPFISKLGAMPEQTRSLYLNKMASSDMIPFFSQSESSRYHHQPKEDYFGDMKKVSEANAIQREVILNAIFNQTNRGKSAVISEKELRKMLDSFTFDETIDIALGLHIPLESEHLVLKHVKLEPGKRVPLEPAITEASVGGKYWKPQPKKPMEYHTHQNLGNHFFVGLIALLVASKMIILNHERKKKKDMGVVPLPVADLDTVNVETGGAVKSDLEKMKQDIRAQSAADAIIQNAAERSIPVTKPNKTTEHEHWVVIDHVAVPVEDDVTTEIVFPESLRFGGSLLERLKKEYDVCQYVVSDNSPHNNFNYLP